MSLKQLNWTAYNIAMSIIAFSKQQLTSEVGNLQRNGNKIIYFGNSFGKFQFDFWSTGFNNTCARKLKKNPFCNNMTQSFWKLANLFTFHSRYAHISVSSQTEGGPMDTM